jgi:hypothetical protein
MIAFFYSQDAIALMVSGMCSLEMNYRTGA